MVGWDSASRDGVEVDGRGREEWSRLLEDFDDASIYQTWDYGSVRWGEKNLSRMVLTKNGRIISAAQSRILHLPLLRTGMAYTFYGPMWRIRGMRRDIESFRLGLRAMIDEYVRKRGLILRVRPWGFEERDEDMRNILVEEGFLRGRGIHHYKNRTILVDLKPTEEELRTQLLKGWHRNLKRAESGNLEIIEAPDQEAWDRLVLLHGETLAMKKFKPGSSVQEFREIQRRLPPNLKMRVTFCRKDGSFISVAVCCPQGDTAIGLMSASGPSGREARAFYLLQWDEVLWAKREGKASLDLGGFNPDTNPGVYHFKVGLGGREVSRLGLFDKFGSPLFYRAATGLESLFRLRGRLTEKYRSLRRPAGS